MSGPGNAMVVYPVDRLGGELAVPGDKSISQRLVMLCALADGTSRIRGLLRAEDCLHTAGAMEALGARFDFSDPQWVTVQGTAGRLTAPGGPLYMGNSGTGMRLLTGLLSGFDGLEAELDGDASLRARPMKRIQEPLERMGADLALRGEGGRPPVVVRGKRLRGIDYVLPVASAQVKSCVLLAGLQAEGRTRVVEKRPTRDHTERLFLAMGLPLRVEDERNMEIEGTGGRPLRLPARDWDVPGDFSSAAFWFTAAAMRPGARITVDRVGLNPRRTALLRVLQRMGATVEVEPYHVPGLVEPMGRVHVEGNTLRGTVVEGAEIPNVIDECPLVAVAGAMAEGWTEIRDAGELRVKETDRIEVMSRNLRAAGVEVETRPDGLRVRGRPEGVPGGGRAASHGDHRMTMSMAILACYAGKAITLEGIECVNTSYPEFWMHLKQLGGRFE